MSKICVFEGISGSGKSSVIEGISKVLEEPTIIHWFDNEYISEVLNNIQDRIQVSRDVFSLCYALEFWGKYKYCIQPLLLKKSMILLHRYIFTPLTHDYARGTKKEKLKLWYNHAALPDKIIFMNTCPETALERILKYRIPSFYECGLDYFFFSELSEAKYKYINQDFSIEQLCDFYLKFQTIIYNNYIEEFSDKKNVLWLEEEENVDIHINKVKEYLCV